MNENGLAQQYAENAGARASNVDQLSEQKLAEILDMVIELLQKGVSPDELIKQGVPEEIVMMALQSISPSNATEESMEQEPMRNNPMQNRQGLASMMA